MLARYEILGKVGKIKMFENNNGKKSLFISIVTSRFYDGEWYTTWHNNIVAYGKTAEIMKQRVVPGNLVRVEGDITVSKLKDVKFGEKNYFVVKSFLNIAKTAEERRKYTQSREENKDTEDNSYDEYQKPVGEDDLPY